MGRVRFLMILVEVLFVTIASVAQGLVYSTNPEYRPYDWSDDGKTFHGASIDLLQQVLPSGIQASAVVLPWRRAQDMAKSGQIDLLVSLRVTPERSEYLEFTTHRAFPNPIVVFARVGSGIHVDSWSDLKGHRGGVSNGDTFGAGFDAYWPSQLTVEVADTMVENFRKLDAGRIDWFVTSLWAGQAYLALHPPQNPIIPLEPAISNSDIYWGFSKRSPWLHLIPTVSQRLAELDRQGVPEALLRKSLNALIATTSKGAP